MTQSSAASDFDINVTYGIMKAIIIYCNEEPVLEAGFLNHTLRKAGNGCAAFANT